MWTGVQAGQSFTDSTPSSDCGFTGEFAVAVSESTRPPPHPVSFAHTPDGTMFALIVVPSMVPDAEDVITLAQFRVKFRPDCETVKLASLASIDLPQGKSANLAVSARTFQRPPTDVGAERLRPLLNTPARHNSG